MPEVRLIDANALEQFYESGTDPLDTYADMTYIRAEHIENAPTIEPEVRHGRWVFQKGDNKETVDGWICTNCKSGFHTKVPYFECFKFCPMCGARMDGGADNG